MSTVLMKKRYGNYHFYDNFESISISPVWNKFPKNVKYLYAQCYDDCRIYTSSFDFAIPMTVTHLVLLRSDYRPAMQIICGDAIFYMVIITKIPNSVTHLTFKGNFNEPIDNCIP